MKKIMHIIRKNLPKECPECGYDLNGHEINCPGCGNCIHWTPIEFGTCICGADIEQEAY